MGPEERNKIARTAELQRPEVLRLALDYCEPCGAALSLYNRHISGKKIQAENYLIEHLHDETKNNNPDLLNLAKSFCTSGVLPIEIFRQHKGTGEKQAALTAVCAFHIARKKQF